MEVSHGFKNKPFGGQHNGAFPHLEAERAGLELDAPAEPGLELEAPAENIFKAGLTCSDYSLVSISARQFK